MEIQKCYYVRQYIKHLIAAIYFFFIHLSDTEPAERNCFRSAFGLDMNKSFVFCSVFKLRPQWRLHHVTCLCDSFGNDLGKDSVRLVLGSLREGNWFEEEFMCQIQMLPVHSYLSSNISNHIL